MNEIGNIPMGWVVLLFIVIYCFMLNAVMNYADRKVLIYISTLERLVRGFSSVHMYISTKSKYENTTNRIHFPLMIVV